ncbi:MAG TPA: hypothetical protein VM689_03505 [Aliidongia sp.]|nr:hypothetical protein [Aliidongia sp.]
MSSDSDELIAGPSLVDRMVELARAKPSDHVTIASRDVELLIDLLKHGFAQAACAAPNGAPMLETADLLLIPDTTSLRSFELTLDRLCRHLQAGGTIVVHDAQAGHCRRRRQIRQILLQHGLAPVGECACGQGVLMSACKGAAVAQLRSAA